MPYVHVIPIHCPFLHIDHKRGNMGVKGHQKADHTVSRAVIEVVMSGITTQGEGTKKEVAMDKCAPILAINIH